MRHTDSHLCNWAVHGKSCWPLSPEQADNRLFLLQVGATVAKCLIDLVEHAALVDAWGNDRG
jgi:hypothetical protein